MIKKSYRDLIFALILTIAAVAWLNIPVLDKYPLNIAPYFLLLLFLSGYSLLAVLKPVNQIGVVKRVIYSIVLSLLITIIVSLLSFFNSTSLQMFIVIPVLTFILILIAFIRRRNAFKRDVLWRIKEEVGFDEEQIQVEQKELSQKLLDKLDLEVSESKINDKVKTVESDSKIEPVKSNEEKIKSGMDFYAWDLVLIGFFTVLSVLFILSPFLSGTVARTVLGLFLVLFLPGYSLIAALFPKQGDLDGVERLALSFGLSIAVTPLIGLTLNYTSYGIRLEPILLSLSSLTILLVVVAYLRRRFTASESRFRVDFNGFFKSIIGGFAGESRTGKILSLILILSILLAVSATVYIIVEPKTGESFTEFYILGPGGLASDYPTNLTSGENGSLIIGIVNHENKKASYHLMVNNSGVVQLDEVVTLNNGQSLMIPFNFTAGDPGSGEMVFMLYKLPDDSNVYRSLHLWLNISSSSTGSGSGNLTSSGLVGNGTG